MMWYLSLSLGDVCVGGPWSARALSTLPVSRAPANHGGGCGSRFPPAFPILLQLVNMLNDVILFFSICAEEVAYV
jgi:hypothetical protein